MAHTFERLGSLIGRMLAHSIRVVRCVEKPKEHISDLAVIGGNAKPCVLCGLVHTNPYDPRRPTQ